MLRLMLRREYTLFSTTAIAFLCAYIVFQTGWDNITFGTILYHFISDKVKLFFLINFEVVLALNMFLLLVRIFNWPISSLETKVLSEKTFRFCFFKVVTALYIWEFDTTENSIAAHLDILLLCSWVMLMTFISAVRYSSKFKCELYRRDISAAPPAGITRLLAYTTVGSTINFVFLTCIAKLFDDIGLHLMLFLGLDCVIFSIDFLLVIFQCVICIIQIRRNGEWSEFGRWMNSVLYGELVTRILMLFQVIQVWIMEGLPSFSFLDLYLLRALVDTYRQCRTVWASINAHERMQQKFRQSCPLATESDLQNDATCAICLEDMMEGFARKLPCGHIFHTSCAYRWLFFDGSLGRCPVCRSQLLSSNSSNDVDQSVEHQETVSTQTTSDMANTSTIDTTNTSSTTRPQSDPTPSQTNSTQVDTLFQFGSRHRRLLGFLPIPNVTIRIERHRQANQNDFTDTARRRTESNNSSGTNRYNAVREEDVQTVLTILPELDANLVRADLALTQSVQLTINRGLDGTIGSNVGGIFNETGQQNSVDGSREGPLADGSRAFSTPTNRPYTTMNQASLDPTVSDSNGAIASTSTVQSSQTASTVDTSNTRINGNREDGIRMNRTTDTLSAIHSIDTHPIYRSSTPNEETTDSRNVANGYRIREQRDNDIEHDTTNHYRQHSHNVLGTTNLPGSPIQPNVTENTNQSFAADIDIADGENGRISAGMSAAKRRATQLAAILRRRNRINPE